MYPINGFTLSKQIKWGKTPEIVFIYVGGCQLEPSKTPGIYYLALEYDQNPDNLKWPVHGIHVLIVWGSGPSAEVVQRVYDNVKTAGALSVNVTVSVNDYDTSSYYFAPSEDLEQKKIEASIINTR